jgi:uncharacterized membrane protein (UPF0127 family)
MITTIIASTFCERLMGLIAHQHRGTVVLTMSKCNAIHTCFMWRKIDVYFYKGRELVRTETDVKPWRFLYCKEADNVVEVMSC